MLDRCCVITKNRGYDFGIMIYVVVTSALILFSVTVPARADGSLLIIDRWWGVDYAREHCRIPTFKPVGKSEAVCDQESREGYNRFEIELKTQFAATLECAGITVSSFGYPQKSEARVPSSMPYWSFSIDYNVDSGSNQSWQMLPPRGNGLPMMEAVGTPSQIAREVCRIIKGKGGAIAGARPR